MANTASTSLNRLQKQSFSFVMTDRDGNVDTATTAQLSSNTPTCATIAIDPTDNRKAWITAQSPGGALCSVQRPGSNTPLNINVTVTDIDLSGVALGAFDPPVAK